MSQLPDVWPLPSEWSWVPFSNVAVIAQDLVQPGEVMDLPHIAPNHMESGTRRLLDYRTVREDGVVSAKQRFYPGQILYSKIRPYLRKAVAVDFVGVCSADVYPLSPTSAVERGYLLYWLVSEDFKQIAMPHQGRTLLPKINQVGLNSTKVPLPPLAEQRRIVAKVDALSNRTARARADLDRVPALTARYKQAVLAKAFSGELTADWRARGGTEQRPVEPRAVGELRSKYRLEEPEEDFSPPYTLPACWQWLRLPRLGDMDRGKSRHRPRDDARLFGGPYPFIQTGEVRAANRYLTSYSKTYSEFGLEQSRLWPKGTVCITIAANIAETAILGVDACFPDSVVGFNPDADRALPEYVEYFIRTAKADLAQFAPATAQKNINLDVLGGVRVPVAPVDEQREIIRCVDRAFAEIDKLTAEAASARRLLDRLDQAVLAKAFRGELVPQDPADEPATVLLDRIKAKREDVPTARRGRRPKAA